MKSNELNSLIRSGETTEQMPVLFIGHGSPMNAIEENEFSASWAKIAKSIPVLEMSLDYYKAPQYHYDLAKELKILRSKGVLITGSGNMVHNLGRIAWDHASDPEYGFTWALQANETFKELIHSGNHKDLINYKSLGREVQLAVPTPDHYLPLLYALALKEENEPIAVFNDKALMGSITMTSLKIG